MRRGRATMRDLDGLFRVLAKSAFRRKFRLGPREQAILHAKGLAQVLDEAQRLIRQRLGPAVIPNDGRQTPWRNHPVFVAQHATATCCRGCLAKWHRIEKGHELTFEEIGHIVQVIGRWLKEQGADEAGGTQGMLF